MGLFGWLRRPKKQTLDRRGFYRYFDGRQWKYEDPLELWRRFGSFPDIQQDIELSQTLEHPNLPKKLADEAEEAYQRVLDAVCIIFEVQRFDSSTGVGLSMDELTNLMMHYSVYMDELKKKRDKLRRPSPSSDWSGFESQASESPEASEQDSTSTPTSSPQDAA